MKSAIAVRWCRDNLGMSQRKFAEKLGVSTMTVYYWETGTYIPRMTNMQKLCELCNISMLEFWLASRLDDVKT